MAVNYAHADMRELEQLLESHTLFSAFQPRPTFYCIYILSRLPMLTIDDDVCRHVWNGKIAIQITLDPVEAAGKETEPIYVMLDTHLLFFYQVTSSFVLVDWGVTVFISTTDNAKDIPYIRWAGSGSQRQREWRGGRQASMVWFSRPTS